MVVVWSSRLGDVRAFAGRTWGLLGLTCGHLELIWGHLNGDWGSPDENLKDDCRLDLPLMRDSGHLGPNLGPCAAAAGLQRYQ